jgi:hypothetical protein
MKMLPLFVLLMCVCGCSQQKNFAERLKDADRLIVTYPRDSLTTTVTGSDVKKVVQAIAGGKRESDTLDCSPGLQYQFFTATQHLGTITTCVEAFWIDGKAYSDRSGTLKAIDQRYHEEHPPSLSP